MSFFGPDIYYISAQNNLSLFVLIMVFVLILFFFLLSLKAKMKNASNLGTLKLIDVKRRLRHIWYLLLSWKTTQQNIRITMTRRIPRLMTTASTTGNSSSFWSSTWAWRSMQTYKLYFLECLITGQIYLMVIKNGEILQCCA